MFCILAENKAMKHDTYVFKLPNGYCILLGGKFYRKGGKVKTYKTKSAAEKTLNTLA